MEVLVNQVDFVLMAVEQNPTAKNKDCAIAIIAMLVEKGKELEKR